jgi:hypothetical protein
VKLSKLTKTMMAVLCLILALLFSGMAYYELKVPKYEEQEKVYYTYQSSCNISYRVFLKPNLMFDRTFLGEGRNYVYKYIDYVDVRFVYQFEGSDHANLKTNYKITGYLEGLHGKENEVLWSKEYALSPLKTEEETNKNKRIDIKVPLTLDHYQNIKETIFTESEINSPVVLRVVFDVHTLAETAKGTLEDSLSPYIIIPVGERVFKIEGEPKASGKDTQIEKIRIIKPVNTRMVAVLFSLSFVFLALAVLTIDFIRATPPLDDFERAIARIFKEYGERLAGIEHAVPYQRANIISINSIEDMIKIADEVDQPVFYYKVDSPTERKIEFFVFDQNRIYYMVMFGEI